jgi:hypothetical protein
MKPEGILVFISAPNKCDGCPIEELFPKGVPVGFKIAHKCMSIQNKFDVFYGLTDWGYTICFVYEKITGEA